MILDFSQKGLNFIFEISDNGTLTLRQCSYGEHHVNTSGPNIFFPASELQLTGENPDGHHGSKHTDSYGRCTLKYAANRVTENALGRKIEIDLTNDKAQMTLHYQLHESICAIRAWSTVTNIGSEPIGLEYITSFAMTGLEMSDESRLHVAYNATPREFNWKSYTMSELGLDKIAKGSMQHHLVSNTGTWSCKDQLPMGAFTAPHGAILWQIEHNGSWCYELGDMRDWLYLRLSGPTEQEHSFYRELVPGETFESVKCALALGKDLDAAIGEMTKYRRTIIQNNAENAAMPVIFNDYMNAIMADPTTEKLIPIIDGAALTGAEYFCIDAGWYADGTWWDCVGEWKACERRFPNGFVEVFDRIRERGMIPGIWLEIEVMGIHCPLVAEFEDECFFMRHGKKVIDHGRYQLDFRHPKVRAHAHEVVDRVIQDYGVGYIKFDYNIEAGVGTEVDADSVGDGLYEHDLALLDWFREVKEKHPHLIIENCSSGGMRMDYAMLSLAHLQSTSDQTDYRHTATLASNATVAALPEQAAVWSYPSTEGDEYEASFNMVNAMLTRIHLSCNVFKLTEQQLHDVKEGVRLYKTIRHLIPRFIPFYPLGLNAYNADFCCVGYRAENEAYIAVWRVNAETDAVTLPVSAASVEVFYPTNHGAHAEIGGDTIRVSLPSKVSAVILKVALS